MPDRKQKIEALVESVPGVIEPVFGKDACVLATRVGLQLLHEVGVEAKPLPVRLVVYNQAMATRVGNDPGRLFDPWSPEDEKAAMEEGCWSVMVGWVWPGDEWAREHRFVGHAVLTTTNPDGIIDLTLDQASRPKLGIEVEPAFMPLDREGLRALRNGTGAAGYHELDSGARMVYALADDLFDKLRTAPDWSGQGYNQMVREKTISECRKEFRRRLR